MDRNDMIYMLNDLIQLDANAVEAYDHFLKHFEYEDLKRRFRDYQDDHRNHIRDLSALVRQLDGNPLKPTPDLKGYLLEVFTTIMSMTGSMAAMEAMKANEIITNRKYQEAVAIEDLPEEIKTLLLTHYSQEQRHLRFIEEVINIPRHELR